MNKIVYITGAGFSAPLGLPLMNNFLIKGKDLYFDDPERYSHFKDVIEQIRELSSCKNVFSTDLLNIEEILSILEMGSFLEGKKLHKKFIQFIKDTIIHHTPPFSSYTGEFPGNWYSYLVGHAFPWQGYGTFFANLLNLTISKKEVPTNQGTKRVFIPNVNQKPTHTYSLVTFNYDLIYEKFIQYLDERFFQNELYPYKGSQNGHILNGIPFSKLHGSVDTDTIVPPTWSKGVHKEVTESWKRAYEAIKEATEIRIIGYSLPDSDSYVKYLFKSAIQHSQHLKKIDVICYDPSGNAKQRYDRFIDFGFYRFSGAKTEDFLASLNEDRNHIRDPNGNKVVFNNLEKKHEKIMNLNA